jgi:hypothetical protein
VSRPTFFLAVLLAGTTACAAASTSQTGAATAPSDSPPGATEAPARPLASLADSRVVLLPVQELRGGDTLGFAAAAGDPRAYLALLDDEIAFALDERKLRPAWASGAEAARMARRNPTFGVDAYALDAGELRSDPKKGGPELSPALSGKLRSLAALHGARYVLVPVELRFAGARGAGRAVLRTVVIDARAAQLVWSGDVSGDPSPSFSPALAASVAGKLADLITAAP